MSSLSYANISRAAIEQNWVVERTSKNHRRLIPPDRSMPIVITAGTSGDRSSIKHFLAQMRLSGFVWPWPELNGSKSESNKSTSEIEIVVEEHAEVESECDVQDRDVMSDAMPDLRDQWIPVVADKPIQAGYMMNIAGEVRSPSGNVLSAERRGNHLWIQFKSAEPGRYEMKRSRLDKVVLLTWVGEPVDPDATPMHINGSLLDCTPDNLRWPCDVKSVNDDEPVEDGPVAVGALNGAAAVKTVEVSPGVVYNIYDERMDEPDDGVSVAVTLSRRGIMLAPGSGDDYSLMTGNGQLDGLSDDDLDTIAIIIARYRKMK